MDAGFIGENTRRITDHAPIELGSTLAWVLVENRKVGFLTEFKRMSGRLLDIVLPRNDGLLTPLGELGVALLIDRELTFSMGHGGRAEGGVGGLRPAPARNPHGDDGGDQCEVSQ